MKVLDATFLIDYLAGVDAAAEFLVANEEEQFVFPAPAYAEVLVGGGNAPDGDVDEGRSVVGRGLRDGQADGGTGRRNCRRDRPAGTVPRWDGRANRRRRARTRGAGGLLR